VSGPALDNVLAIAKRIRPLLLRTPLEPSPVLNSVTGADVYLKCEQMQVTGSFKPRVSAAVLTALDAAGRSRGVVASSAGNHGLGLAWTAQALDITATLFLPENADPSKLGRLRALGAVLQSAPDIEAARQGAVDYAARTGARAVSAYNEPLGWAGTATLALEILEDLPHVDIVVVCVGGGGLAAGAASLLRAVRPTAQVWGATAAASPTFPPPQRSSRRSNEDEPPSPTRSIQRRTTSPTFPTWLAAGKPGTVHLTPSIAEGLSGHIPPDVATFSILQQRVERVVGVTDAELLNAMRWALDHHGMLLEPSGAAALALVLRRLPELAERTVAIVLTGANIGSARLATLLGQETLSTPQ